MMSAEVMSAVRAYISSMIESMSSPLPSRSDQSFRRNTKLPVDEPWPNIMPQPVVLEYASICGMLPTLLSISAITFSVSAMLVPGGVRRSMLMVPMSSLGTRPVLVVFIRYTSPPHATTSMMTVIHLCLNMKSTRCLYLFTTAPNAVSNALWKRLEKLAFLPSTISSCGVMIKAQRAGERVSEFTSEIPTATAIVRPNCV